MSVWFHIQSTASFPAFSQKEMTTPDSEYVSSATRKSLLVFKTFSHEPTRTDSERSSRYRRPQSLLSRRDDVDPPPSYATSLTEYCFMGKVIQLVLIVTATGLFGEGSEIIAAAAVHLFPYVVYGAYIIIMSIVIMSYLLGQKMHEMLIRIFLMLGTILFLAASCSILNVVRNNWHIWDYVSVNDIDNPKVRQKRAMLLLQGLIALVVVVLMATDVVLSIRRSFMQRG